MRLFDFKIRSCQREKRRCQTLWDFYNESAKPEVAGLRLVLQRWFRRIPIDAKQDIRSRVRSKDRNDSYTAIWELYLHEFLCRMGYSVTVHPVLPDSSKRIDFLASICENELFYLEATTAFPSRKNQATDARINQVYAVLDLIDSPDYFLEVRQIEGGPNTPPPAGKLRNAVNEWMESLNYEDEFRRFKYDGIGATSGICWQHETWEIRIRVMPKAPPFRGQGSSPTIGLELGTVDISSISESIRNSLLSKTDYGSLNLPFVVAINAMHDFVGENNLLDALFGVKKKRRTLRKC